MLSQTWVLTPELEIVANGDTNAKYREGSGLSEIVFSLRLGYERSPKFQPFIGFTLAKSFAKTRDFQVRAGEDDTSFEALLGVHCWF